MGGLARFAGKWLVQSQPGNEAPGSIPIDPQGCFVLYALFSLESNYCFIQNREPALVNLDSDEDVYFFGNQIHARQHFPLPSPKASGV